MHTSDSAGDSMRYYQHSEPWRTGYGTALITLTDNEVIDYMKRQYKNMDCPSYDKLVEEYCQRHNAQERTTYDCS